MNFTSAESRVRSPRWIGLRQESDPLIHKSHTVKTPIAERTTKIQGVHAVRDP